MSPDATARGVATRRIRRRARKWKEWQFPDPATLAKTPVEQLRRENKHMRNYHREQAIRWLGNLRRWPEAEAALATVSAELQEFDL